MLTITVLSQGNVPLDPRRAARFPLEGGSIGRSSTCTLVLPDPTERISRVHAVVSFRSGAWVLLDQGTVLPVELNGQRLGRGREVMIDNGDEICIGSYVLRVSRDYTAPREVPPPVPERTVERRARPRSPAPASEPPPLDGTDPPQ